jgi:protein-tyrosine-phosphatase
VTGRECEKSRRASHREYPLFVCHANYCRSVLACYLYRHLCQAPARSAGFEPGERMSARAQEMLRAWGIAPDGHEPERLSIEMCRRADAIFVMAPTYLHRLLREFGQAYAGKTYLFADPFSQPLGFQNREYVVSDPSFDFRPTRELLHEFTWMRERVLQIRLALIGSGPALVPASEYLSLCESLDPYGH